MKENSIWIISILVATAAIFLSLIENIGTTLLYALASFILLMVFSKPLFSFVRTRGETVARWVMVLVVAMPIYLVSGCCRMTMSNSFSKYDLVLFTGGNNAQSVAVGDENLTLQPLKIVQKTIYDVSIQLTNPQSKVNESTQLTQVLNIVAYGENYELEVEEIGYEPLSLGPKTKIRKIPSL